MFNHTPHNVDGQFEWYSMSWCVGTGSCCYLGGIILKGIYPGILDGLLWFRWRCWFNLLAALLEKCEMHPTWWRVSLYSQHIVVQCAWLFDLWYLLLLRALLHELHHKGLSKSRQVFLNIIQTVNSFTLCTRLLRLGWKVHAGKL